MDWLALLFKHFNMRGTYQLCSVFEEGVLAHQSIQRYDGRNWTGKNVLQQRNQLRKIIRPDTSVQVSSFIAGHGIELFRLAKEKGLEGIMAKRAASTYQAGSRSTDPFLSSATISRSRIVDRSFNCPTASLTNPNFSSSGSRLRDQSRALPVESMTAIAR
jgi:hypothetical protein